MVHETITNLSAAEVLSRAKTFFAERIPHNAAYPETEGAGYVALRGQGGEEVALAAISIEGGTRVRASTLLFDQAVARFLSTLPAAGRGLDE